MKQRAFSFWERFTQSGAFLPCAGLLAGLFAGVVAALYRLCLSFASDALGSVLSLMEGSVPLTLLWFGALAVLALLVSLLLRFEPLIGGSGIPQMESEAHGELDSRWLRVLVCKFAGGFLCLLGGLSLGREGPSIQLGAMAGKGLSRLLRRPKDDERMLLSCGASAGLAAAFHAPAAGVLFCLEEVHHRFTPRLLIPLLTAVLSADLVSMQVFGVEPVFRFAPRADFPPALYLLILLLGLLLGVLGAVYNTATMYAVRLLQYKSRMPVFVRVLLPFLAAGVLALCAPALLGSGHELVEEAAAGDFVLRTLVLLLLGKFLFSLLSFSSGAPGGIFFPDRLLLRPCRRAAFRPRFVLCRRFSAFGHGGQLRGYCARALYRGRPAFRDDRLAAVPAPAAGRFSRGFRHRRSPARASHLRLPAGGIRPSSRRRRPLNLLNNSVRMACPAAPRFPAAGAALLTEGCRPCAAGTARSWSWRDPPAACSQRRSRRRDRTRRSSSCAPAGSRLPNGRFRDRGW